MKDLLSNSSKRQVQLLQMLNNHTDERWLTFKDIATALNCSEKILDLDIKNIENKYDYIKFKQQKDSIDVQIDLNKGVTAFYADEFRNSLSYQILETVFFNPNISVNELTKIVQSSVATTYRTISTINTVLQKDYNIKLQTNPCKMLGSEKEIRGFYYEMFTETNELTEWPFKEIEIEPLKELTVKILNQTEFELDIYRMRNSVISFAVNIIRNKQGFLYYEDDKIQMSYLKKTIFSPVMEDVHEYFRNCGLKENDRTFMDVLYPYGEDRYYLSFKELAMRIDEDLYTKKSYIILNEFITVMSEKYELPVDDKEFLIRDLHNVAYFNNTNNISRAIIVDPSEKVVAVLREYLPEMYEDIVKYLRRYLKEMEIEETPEKIEFMLHSVLMNWKHMVETLLVRTEQIKILVVSNLENYHVDVLVNLLKGELPNRVLPVAYKGYDVTAETFKEIPYDIIVTTFPIDGVKGKDIIYVDGFPTIRDLKRIVEIINVHTDRRFKKV